MPGTRASCRLGSGRTPCSAACAARAIRPESHLAVTRTPAHAVGSTSATDGAGGPSPHPTVTALRISAPRSWSQGSQIGFGLSVEMGVETHSLRSLGRGDSDLHRSATGLSQAQATPVSGDARNGPGRPISHPGRGQRIRPCADRSASSVRVASRPKRHRRSWVARHVTDGQRYPFRTGVLARDARRVGRPISERRRSPAQCSSRPLPCSPAAP
jgi:hypothetical protein